MISARQSSPPVATIKSLRSNNQILLITKMLHKRRHDIRLELELHTVERCPQFCHEFLNCISHMGEMLAFA
jgi:hypothetical protein